MSRDIKDGGPAFPSACMTCDCKEAGMSLRDYFAALSLRIFQCPESPSMTHPISTVWADSLARDAYLVADALLRAREGKP